MYYVPELAYKQEGQFLKIENIHLPIVRKIHMIGIELYYQQQKYDIKV